jgi:Protein of unknown function (DUF2914)/Tetratricopeptide repeat
MTETREIPTLIESAEQAAASGDYASAERLLNEAALLQEASLGPVHPDLANTLNNLGVVCDRADRVDEAEYCYRKAYAITQAALEPDHPFVLTSRKNLEDFCAARGRPFELPPAPQPEHIAHGSKSSMEESPDDLPAPSSSYGWLGVSVVATVGVLALAWVITTRTQSDSQGEAPKGATSREAQTPAPQTATETSRLATQVANPARPKKVEATTGSSSTVASGAPSVITAQLCKGPSFSAVSGSGGDWRCDSAGETVSAGPLVFYTRLKSSNDTTIQHRWYHGDRLQQQVELQIRANPAMGYRTYSRHSVKERSPGDWKVELRGKDGALLHEERFVVQ